MIRHVALFRFDPGASADQIHHLAEGLDELATTIPGIVAYHHGRDVGVSDGAFDYGVVADFTDTDAFVGYREHPAHQALITERLAPIRTERATLQFDLGA